MCTTNFKSTPTLEVFITCAERIINRVKVSCLVVVCRLGHKKGGVNKQTSQCITHSPNCKAKRTNE